MLLRNSSSLVSLLRGCLVDFPLYEGAHHVNAHENSMGFDAQYSSLEPRPSNLFKAFRLHIAIRGNVHGFIGSVYVPLQEERKGYGSSLVRVGENVLKKAGCIDVELTPSGKSRDVFYEKLGYSKTLSGLMFKSLI